MSTFSCLTLLSLKFLLPVASRLSSEFFKFRQFIFKFSLAEQSIIICTYTLFIALDSQWFRGLMDNALDLEFRDHGIQRIQTPHATASCALFAKLVD